jgi:hypothetical protein
MKKIYAIVNTLIILLVIFWNYWSNTGAINGKTVGGLSDQYANYFTPAGYAFAIWGIIFLGLLVLGISQLIWAFKDTKNSDSILQIGPWLSIANIGNGLWLWFWLHEQTGISVLIMLLILFSLSKAIINLNMEIWDAPASIIAFVWWPISAYSGWIAVATIANISSWLAKLNWVAVFSEVQWTVIMISVAAILNLILVYKRNMREFAIVGVWAILAIAIRHWGSIPVIQWTAISWLIVLSIAILIHGLKNRHSNPFLKIFQGK